MRVVSNRDVDIVLSIDRGDIGCFLKLVVSKAG